jgi:hypothetical protein
LNADFCFIDLNLKNVQITAFALSSSTQTTQCLKTVMTANPTSNLLLSRISLSLSLSPYLLSGNGEKNMAQEFNSVFKYNDLYKFFIVKKI